MKKRLIPRKRVREKFLLTYELEGCQKGVDFLTRYYGIRRMKIVVDGRRVGNGDIACYENNRAYFTKRGLNKHNVLHELYHHLVYVNGLDMPKRMEEKDANHYAKGFVKRP
jgi:hypothetical protein